MANPPKMKDPTEAALSAIQDALKVRDADSSATMVAPPLADDRASERAWPGLRSGKTSDAFEDAPRHEEEPEAPRRPANDDRESIGQMLRAVQRQSSGRP